MGQRLYSLSAELNRKGSTACGEKNWNLLKKKKKTVNREGEIMGIWAVRKIHHCLSLELTEVVPKHRINKHRGGAGMKDKEGGLPERWQEGIEAAQMCEYEGDGIWRRATSRE